VSSPDADHVVAIMYTSGTTGPPKGVMLSNAMYQAAGRTAALVADVRPGDVLFLWEPLYHIAGVQAITLCLQRGVSCALVDRFSASTFWDQVRRYGATQIHYLGGVLGLLMKQPARPDDAENPARIAWGAAASPDVWPRFEQRFGVRIHECYGLTEGASFTTANLAGTVGSIGRPIEDFEVRIVDDDDQPVPDGQRGEIVQRERTPGLLMKGYFKDRKARARRCGMDGFTRGTSAIGLRRLLLLSRGDEKDRIRRPTERTSRRGRSSGTVSACPGVEECAVIGIPSELGGRRFKLFVRPAAGATVDPLDVIRWCEERLAYFPGAAATSPSSTRSEDAQRAHSQGRAATLGRRLLGSRAVRPPAPSLKGGMSCTRTSSSNVRAASR
jgi:crotonobetaine/carnitine-CoA ligase